jgi:probable HAF family extracellular repeat protein
VHRYAPVVWGPEADDIEVLPLLAGDEVGFAYGINDHDQVVGSTGACASTSVIGSAVLTGRHAVLWDRGVAFPLDAPGSSDAISTAYSINDRSAVVGVSGTTSLHGFLWTRRTGMQSLGAVESDVGSIANWINNRGEIVGASCPEVGVCEPGPAVPSRAFLWRNGVMMDLNALAVGTTMYLVTATAMNDRGQIVGLGISEDGLPHAFLATPVSRPGQGQPSADRRGMRPMTLPLRVRRLSRFGSSEG